MIQPLHLGLAVALLLTSCGELIHNYRYSSSPRPEAKAGGGGAVAFAASATRGTLLSIVQQPVTTATLGGAVLLQRPHELLAGNLPDSSEFLYSPAQAPGTPGFEALLDRARIPPPALAKLTWLVDGKSFFPEIERQIRNARRSIDVQVYIFDNDDVAVRQADLLKQHSTTADVRVLFDDLGSMTAAGKAPDTAPPPGFVAPRKMSKYLRDGSRIQVRSMLNPWLVCDHTKLLVFDQNIALMGCANIGREYLSEWHDLMFRVEGPAVALLQDDYNRTWRRAAPFALAGLFQKNPAATPPSPAPGAVAIRILRTDPAAGRFEIRESMLLVIQAARKRIWIEDPYVAHDDITEALKDAARRGVDVRLIYPGQNDSKIMDTSNRAFADELVKAGGKAYVYPRMTHLKVMICDDWACVGSANMDTLSMRINRELNITVSAPIEITKLVNQIFLPDFRVSKRHSTVDSSPPAAGLAEAVADQL
ncbi:MAG: phosphatidylserine/phosphatidylglycerophosphate/cardiolipin synthase family protein [Verrucomicrobiota bacterium]